MVECKGGSRHVEGGFQDIDFPECTIIIQGIKDAQKMVSRDVPQLFKISKIPKNDLPRCTKDSKMHQYFKMSNIRKFQSSKIY